MTIKLTGGIGKGQGLKVYQKGQVRPTSDKIRQAIFNILQHRFDADFENKRVLDLYAGSGSLGAEAWSRGAQWICAVESHKSTAQVLHSNLSKLAPLLGGQWFVRTQKVQSFLNQSSPQSVDFIFLDPPYQEFVLPSLLDLFIQKGWVHTQSLVVMEHSKRHDFDPSPEWDMVFRRKYGDTLVSICTLVEGEP